MLLSIRSESSCRKDYPKRTFFLRCDNTVCGKEFEKKLCKRHIDVPVHTCSRTYQAALQHKACRFNKYGADSHQTIVDQVEDVRDMLYMFTAKFADIRRSQ